MGDLTATEAGNPTGVTESGQSGLFGADPGAPADEEVANLGAVVHGPDGTATPTGGGRYCRDPSRPGLPAASGGRFRSADPGSSVSDAAWALTRGIVHPQR
ncbi:hypothetical protein FRAHR75_740010 [Frankia sp. Hr75.2]|nr:hypothetical protein FRAHR75_740010 [Frankia sp. Hr75.2]